MRTLATQLLFLLSELTVSLSLQECLLMLSGLQELEFNLTESPLPICPSCYQILVQFTTLGKQDEQRHVRSLILSHPKSSPLTIKRMKTTFHSPAEFGLLDVSYLKSLAVEATLVL